MVKFQSYGQPAAIDNQNALTKATDTLRQMLKSGLAEENLCSGPDHKVVKFLSNHLMFFLS